MPLLKLSCVNCSAPLEIGADLDRFACGYCGTNQVVQRSGGVIALRRVESAVQAVQRGTDKTAAELAVPRLQRELVEAQQAKAKAVEQAKTKRSRELGGRRLLTGLVATVIFCIGFGVVLWMLTWEPISSSVRTVAWIWLVTLVAAPTFVFYKTKLPPDTTAEALAPHDATIERIVQRIRENKAILDA